MHHHYSTYNVTNLTYLVFRDQKGLGISIMYRLRSEVHLPVPPYAAFDVLAVTAWGARVVNFSSNLTLKGPLLCFHG